MIFKRHLKTHLFCLNLTSAPSSSSYKKKKKKKKTLNPLLSFLNLSLSSFCSEQCLKCCITSTPCDCLPPYNVSLIVFLNCKSLWIKVSAKLINVNVNPHISKIKYQVCISKCVFLSFLHSWTLSGRFRVVFVNFYGHWNSELKNIQ